MRLLLAFLRRDLKIAASYKTSFVFAAVGGLVTLTTFFFLARTVGDSPALASKYGSDYFSFALLGVSVAAALRTVQTSFARRLREAQTDGSLEVLLSAPRSTFQVIALLSAYPILNALVRSVLLLVVGSWLFGANLHLDPLAFGLSLLLALTSFGALGLVSAAFVLSFKRGDPFSYLLDVLTYLLAGVIYPVEVLPPFLQKAADFLPATWALRALREAALNGSSLSGITRELLILAAFAIVLWPLAALALSVSRRWSEKAGTLAHG
ncbi:MAG: ABC transporter permease [Myxococcaceae bacterium]